MSEDEEKKTNSSNSDLKKLADQYRAAAEIQQKLNGFSIPQAAKERAFSNLS